MPKNKFELNYSLELTNDEVIKLEECLREIKIGSKITEENKFLLEEVAERLRFSIQKTAEINKIIEK
jgi:hypothetical protein